MLDELTVALTLLYQCMAFVDGELHDEIAIAANGFGWWMPDNPPIRWMHGVVCPN
jgi:hypothetical protein